MTRQELKSKQEELLSNIDRAVSSLMTCGELIGERWKLGDAETTVKQTKQSLGPVL